MQHFCGFLADEQACKIHIDQKDTSLWHVDLLEFNSVPAA